MNEQVLVALLALITAFSVALWKLWAAAVRADELIVQRHNEDMDRVRDHLDAIQRDIREILQRVTRIETKVDNHNAT